jgi:hypothetical protein
MSCALSAFFNPHIHARLFVFVVIIIILVSFALACRRCDLARPGIYFLIASPLRISSETL